MPIGVNPFAALETILGIAQEKARPVGPQSAPVMPVPLSPFVNMFAQPKPVPAVVPPQMPAASDIFANPDSQPLFRGLDGETITSEYRDPAKNKSVGGTANSFHMRRDASGRPLARDSIPPKGMSMADYAARLTALNPHMEVINEGDHVHMEPRDGSSFVQGVKDATNGQMINAFDPSAYNPALASINQAQQAAMTPFDVSVERSPLPEMPGAPDFAEKDFTQTDALMAGLAPEAFSEQEASGLKRRRLWQGAAAALASLPEDAHVGSILAKVGAGILGGRLSADDEIQARADAYDEKMREYQLLKLNYENEKASQKLNEANAEAAAGYQHAMTGWNTKMQQWQADNNVQFQNGMAIIQRPDENGNLQVEGVPIASMIEPIYAMKRAEVQIGIANAQNDEAIGNARLINGAVIQAGMSEAQVDWLQDAGGPNSDVGMLTGTAVMASEAVGANLGSRIVGEDQWAADVEAARTAVQESGVMVGSSGYEEAINKALTARLMEHIVKSENARNNLMQYQDILSGLDALGQRTTIRRKQGDTTVTQER